MEILHNSIFMDSL